MNYLIADSGSTKTSWVFIDDEGRRNEFETQGINPVRDSEEQLALALPREEDMIYLQPRDEGGDTPFTTGRRLRVRFYGAGCMHPYSDTLHRVLQRRFPEADISVESDLLGAAYALCGHTEGIACILGTGSNSCHYDGERIVQNVSPLGWILGDEGSGAVLGKNLVGDILKGQMSIRLQEAFAQETGLDRIQIIDKVYREPMPNRFLASLVYFLGRHREEREIHDFLVRNFRSFFQRNVAQYRRADLPVHFVGGVAYAYRQELEEAARLEGYTIGKILQRPIVAIVEHILSESK